MKNPGYKINISQIQDDFIQTNSNFFDKRNNSNDVYNSKINERKDKINEDIQNKSAFHFSSQNSKKSNLPLNKSINNSNNTEIQEKSDNSNKSFLKSNDISYFKKSLVFKNKLSSRSYLKGENSNRNESFLNISTKYKQNKNKNKSFHSKRKLNQNKNNFLQLINQDNNNIKYNNSSYSLLSEKSFINDLDGDSLNLIEKNLQNKIYDMEKKLDLFEFEKDPLDISINKLNVRKKKQKLTAKGSKRVELDKKDLNSSLKKHKTVIHKNIFNLINSNLNNSNSENILLNQKDTNLKFNDQINVNNKKFINNLNSKNKKKKNNHILNKHYKINIIGNNEAGKRSSINHFLKIRSFKSPELSKSKTVSNSNLNLSIGETVTALYNSNKSLIKMKKRKGIYIDNEKFRILTHKKLVYDSVDDEEIIEETISDNLYLNPDDTIVLIVDVLILIITFFNMIYKPLNLVLNNCDIKNTMTLLNFDNIINIFIDLLFIFDLIINFFKSYYNFDEQLVTRSEKIILNYIKGYFIIDLISAIPYYSILKFIKFNNHKKMKIPVKCSKYYNHEIHDRYQIIEVLKLLKLIKCISNNNIITNYIINELHQIIFFENWSFLLNGVILFLLILHLTACLHIFISSTVFPNWITSKNLQTSPFITIYLSSIYFLITTVTSVGYGDIIGNSFTEIVFQIFLLMIGIIAYSWLISSLSNYVKESNKQNEIFNQKLDILNEIKLEHPKIPKELYDKIYLHLEYININQKKDKSTLIDFLPQSVKNPLLYEMYKPIIENFNFFKDFKNSEFVNRIISKLNPIIAVKNDVLLEQGEIIEDTIFVKQGRLSLEVKIDYDHPEKSVEKLLNEEYFFGTENNELYQKSAFGGVLSTTSMNHNQSFINKKNLYNLYSGNTITESNNQKRVKSIIINPNGKNEIQKHPNTNINYIHLRILDVRKNEHFGSLLMFLNKRSPLTLRVKTKKAELFFLRKIDAVEISTNYPNIWKRVNKKSFHNLKQIRNIMKKIIKHFCEAYGINFDFGTKIYNDNLKKLNISNFSKLNSFNNKNSKRKFSKNLQKKIMNPRRASVNVFNTQLKMFKFFPKHDKKVNTKTIISKNIKGLIPDNFGINNNISKNNNNDEQNQDINSPFKKIESIVNDKDNPIDCNVSIIKCNQKDTMLGYGHPIYIRNNNMELSSNNKSLNNNSILFNSNDYNLSKSIKLNDINQNKVENNLNKNIPNLAHYGEEETNNLMKFFGTPYYPEDINDELYPGEIFNIVSQRNENEYSQINNLLLSHDAKNNFSLSKLKNKSLSPFPLNKFNIYNETNNFTINNNYFSNNVIKNESTSKDNNNNLSIFRLSFYLKNEISKTNKNLKANTGQNKNPNFSISRNFFELSKVGNNLNADSNNINDIINHKKNNYKKRGISYDKNNNKINNNSNKKNYFSLNKQHENQKSDIDSLSSSESFDFNSFSSKDSNSNDKNNNNLFMSESKSKNIKILNTVKSIKSSMRTNKIKDKNEISKCLKIKKNIIFNIDANYENLNMITKGKYLKNKKLQEYIKDILIKRVLKNKEKLQSPKKRKSLSNNRLIKNKTISRFQKKFSNNNFNKVNLNNDKLKKTELKCLFKNHLASDIHERSSEINIKKPNNLKEISKYSSNSLPKRVKTRKNNDELLLSYANRNIRDDNAVLNNPRKFYNGFFSTIMRKVNLEKNKVI